MKTDALFFQLFGRYPEAFFELQGQPGSLAKSYRFASLELKETAQRLDGAFLPHEPGLPTYFVEVQFYSYREVYANLLAKIYLYLKQNDPALDFRGVVLFASRSLEPKELGPYRPLLESGHVVPYFLDELELAETTPLGLSILQIVTCAEEVTLTHGRNLIQRARCEIPVPETARKMIEWIETAIMYKLPQMGLQEIQAMLLVDDIRKIRVFQQGVEEGREAERQLLLATSIPQLLAKGIAENDIATIFRIPLESVRAFAESKGAESN